MLKNQVVLVTGGGGRIGSAFCKGIIENRGKVIIGDISQEFGLSLQKELGKKKIIFIETDVTNVDSIKNLIGEGRNHFGTIDSAVHCAYPTSSQWGTRFEELDPTLLSQDLFSQLGASIIFSQQIISYFKENGGGNLIHVASIQGISSPKFEHYENTEMVSPIEYTAIKAATIAITKYLAKYLKQKGIRINSISPGGILDNQPSEFIKKYNLVCNSKGMLDSDDLVGTLVFLLSSQSKFINGQNIIVDDGWSL